MSAWNGGRAQQRNSGYAEDAQEASDDQSTFKRKYKYFKKRSPSPALSEVLNLREIDKRLCRSLDPSETQIDPRDIADLGLRPLDQWTLVTLQERKGLYILTDIVDPAHYLKWIGRCLEVYPEYPGLTNVHLHVPQAQNIFKEYPEKLRWATLGKHYDWASKIYPEQGNPLPAELSKFSDVISRALGLGPLKADAAIINFFPSKGTLGPHVDRSERDLERPLVSMSLGQSGIYLTGGTDLDSPVDALLLQSGDVLVMHGDQRLVYHAVPSVRITTKFVAVDGVSQGVLDYANSHRISLTLRQVDA